MAHGMGYRYRLHRKDLPGKPDLAFPGRRKVIFVHGCFWHQHACPRGARSPKSSRDYWIPKLKRNKQRDAENQSRLREMGWKVLVIWECEMKESGCAREANRGVSGRVRCGGSSFRGESTYRQHAILNPAKTPTAPHPATPPSTARRVFPFLSVSRHWVSLAA